VILESGSDLRTSDPIFDGRIIHAEAGIVSTEPDIKMAEARIISVPPPSFKT
jgi:hypothetical protein